jgi:hypothetical protein
MFEDFKSQISFVCYFSYSESCELCTCNGNPTIAIICSKLAPVIDSSSVVLGPMIPRMPFPQPIRPLPPMNLTIYNYMTIEELKEFMLNEQKVCRTILLLLFEFYLNFIASIVII